MTQNYNYNNLPNKNNGNDKNPMKMIAIIIIATVAIFGYQLRGVIKPHFNTADKILKIILYRKITSFL